MRAITLATLLAFCATASQAQPYSASMAQCAALMQNASQWAQAEENADQLMGAARAWHKAAVTQARHEGVPNAKARMTALAQDQAANWHTKGASFFFTQEFRDWAAYCRKFARAQNIDLGN